MEIGRWVKKWIVESSSNPNKTYVVSISELGIWGCSCPVWKFRRQECKHIQKIKNQEANQKLTIEA